MNGEHASSPSIEDYVVQEAREKAFEISVEGIKEYERAVDEIVNEKKQKIDFEFASLCKDEEIGKRIKLSSSISQSRLLKMKERQDLITSLLQEVQRQVLERLQDRATYKQFVRNLLVQSMLKLGEEEAMIRVLPDESELIEEVVGQTEAAYAKVVESGEAENCPRSIKVHVDSSNFIVRRKDGEPVDESCQFISKSEEDRAAKGGILMASMDGLIVCKNTVDARLEMCYQESLPEIRRLLFGGD